MYCALLNALGKSHNDKGVAIRISVIVSARAERQMQ